MVSALPTARTIWLRISSSSCLQITTSHHSLQRHIQTDGLAPDLKSAWHQGQNHFGCMMAGIPGKLQQRAEAFIQELLKDKVSRPHPDTRQEPANARKQQSFGVTAAAQGPRLRPKNRQRQGTRHEAQQRQMMAERRKCLGAPRMQLSGLSLTVQAQRPLQREHLHLRQSGRWSTHPGRRHRQLHARSAGQPLPAAHCPGSPPAAPGTVALPHPGPQNNHSAMPCECPPFSELERRASLLRSQLGQCKAGCS